MILKGKAPAKAQKSVLYKLIFYNILKSEKRSSILVHGLVLKGLSGVAKGRYCLSVLVIEIIVSLMKFIW